MIEQLPEIQKLSPKEKFQLASELWDEVSTELSAIEPDPAVVQLLEQRNADFKAGQHPSSTWDEVKQRISRR